MNPKHAPALSSNTIHTSASKKEDVQKNKALEEYQRAAMEQFLKELNVLDKLNSRF
jgi:hypothetical protein